MVLILEYHGEYIIQGFNRQVGQRKRMADLQHRVTGRPMNGLGLVGFFADPFQSADKDSDPDPDPDPDLDFDLEDGSQAKKSIDSRQRFF